MSVDIISRMFELTLLELGVASQLVRAASQSVRARALAVRAIVAQTRIERATILTVINTWKMNVCF
jgi:hypothetical protein